MEFKTRWGMPIMSICQAYQFGSKAFYIAMETLVQTAQNSAGELKKDEIALSSCIGNHPGTPPKGLICRACYDAMEAAKYEGIDNPTDLPLKESPEDKAEREKVEREVATMIGGGNEPTE